MLKNNKSFLFICFIIVFSSCLKKQKGNEYKSFFVITDSVYGLSEGSSIIKGQDTIGFIESMKLLKSNDVLLKLSYLNSIQLTYRDLDFLVEEVLFGDDEAKFVFTSPINVNKDPKWTTPTVFDNPNDDDNNKPSGSISEDLLDVD